MLAAALVGRTRELEQLVAALEAMLRGQGDVLLLSGEPGAGKSALARAAEQLARERGALAYWGRCWEAGGGPAYWPLARALAPLLELPEAERWVRAAGPALFDVLPEARALAPELGPASAVDAGSACFAVARALGVLLRRASEHSPLVLLLDDLHAADLASLELLEALAADSKSLRSLFVGTVRDRELDQPSEVRPRLLALQRAARVLPVLPLEEGAARALLERHTGALAEPLAARVLEATRGNALFLVELGRLLQGRSPDQQELPLPLGVREAVRRRVEVLPPLTRQALGVCAVLGVEAPLAIAAGVLGLPGGAELLDRLAPAEALGLLRPGAAGLVRFEHGLVRDALYHELPPEQRRELHLRAARELEQRLVAGDGASEIAHHLLAAGSGARDEACRAAIRAADVAIARAAYDDAAALLERARAEAELELAPCPRTELLIALGRARLLAGELDAGRAACRSAAALAERQGDARAMARAALALGWAWQFGFANREVSELARRALPLLSEQDASLRARLLARLAAAEQPAADPAGPIAQAREAFALARSVGESHTLLEVLHVGMSALMDFAPPAERSALNQETLALARALGERGPELRATQRLALDYLELGDLAASDGAIQAQESLAQPLGHRRHLLPLAYQQAMRACFAGDFAAAAEHRERAESLLEPGAPPPLVLALHRFGVARLRGDVVELVRVEPTLYPGATDSMSLSMRVALRASVCAWSAELEGCRAALARARVRPVLGDPIWCSLVGEAAAMLGERELCALAYEQLAGRRGTFISWGATGAFVDGPYSRVLGLLECGLGRLQEAVSSALAAVAECRVASARPLLARSLLDAAGVLRRRGQSGDGERAGALAAEAAALEAELGMCPGQPLLAVLEPGSGTAPGGAVQVPSSAPPHAAAPRSAASTLRAALRFERSGELWAVELAGRRCHVRNSRGMEILGELVARPHTDVHVLELARGGTEPADGGDAGELLDEPARQAYRARLRELEEELSEAEARADRGHVERLTAEREALQSELSRAFGLGGRVRRAGSAVERARVAVQRRVREAIRRIAELDPALGEHLDRAVRTGATCAYRPGLHER